MKLDIRSVLAGAGLALGIFGLVSMMQAPTHIPPLKVIGVPTPDRIVRLDQQDLPFTVPANQVLVITGVGQRTKSGTQKGQASPKILFDDVEILRVITLMDQTSAGYVHTITPGIVATAGVVVDVDNPPTEFAPAVLLGYLANA